MKNRRKSKMSPKRATKPKNQKTKETQEGRKNRYVKSAEEVKVAKNPNKPKKF